MFATARARRRAPDEGPLSGTSPSPPSSLAPAPGVRSKTSGAARLPVENVVAATVPASSASISHVRVGESGKLTSNLQLPVLSVTQEAPPHFTRCPAGCVVPMTRTGRDTVHSTGETPSALFAHASASERFEGSVRMDRASTDTIVPYVNAAHDALSS